MGYAALLLPSVTSLTEYFVVPNKASERRKALGVGLPEALADCIVIFEVDSARESPTFHGKDLLEHCEYLSIWFYIS